MAYNPAVLHPEPPRWFVNEVKRIDPALRVVFGYGKYLVNKWVIERRLSPARYAAVYAQALREDWKRFVEQPIFDTNQHIFDDEGNDLGYKQVGSRVFDIRPEWEWLAQFDALDGRALLELKRQYAWHVNHPLSRAKYEEAQRLAEAQKEAEEKRKRVDMEFEAVEEAWHEHGKRRSYVLDKGGE